MGDFPVNNAMGAGMGECVFLYSTVWMPCCWYILVRFRTWWIFVFMVFSHAVLQHCLLIDGEPYAETHRLPSLMPVLQTSCITLVGQGDWVEFIIPIADSALIGQPTQPNQLPCPTNAVQDAMVKCRSCKLLHVLPNSERHREGDWSTYFICRNWHSSIRPW